MDSTSGFAGGCGCRGTPYFLPAHVLGRDNATPPSETVRVGVIGCGGRARVIREAADVKGFRVVAACDCVLDRAEKYAQELSGEETWGVYEDFRQMIEQEKLDAVMIETTTHARAWITILAMQMGMDVYIEKPMSLTIAEGRAMVNAARHYDRVTQVGTQQRSMPINNWASDLVKNGAIGKINTVLAPNFVGPFRWTKTSTADVTGPVEPWWDTWTNQAELRPWDPQLQGGWAAGGTMTEADFASESPVGGRIRTTKSTEPWERTTPGRSPCCWRNRSRSARPVVSRDGKRSAVLSSD